MARCASAIGAATATGRRDRPERLPTAKEPHERGAILVAAVFDAFLCDLRGAHAPTCYGSPPAARGSCPGAIHPDLVNRLAEEAAQVRRATCSASASGRSTTAAGGLTFGEYLRALITADRDLVRDDPLGYRIAFIDCFRRRGIYPRDDIRSLSEESLVWRGPNTDLRRPSAQLQGLGASPVLRDFIPRFQFAASRREHFMLEREMRFQLHRLLERYFDDPDTGKTDARFLGLLPGKFEVHSARYANRVGPDGDLLSQFIVEILQRPPRGRERGCTLIVDAKAVELRYVIRKEVRAEADDEEQESGLWRTYYGERGTDWAAREPFAVLHRWLTTEG